MSAADCCLLQNYVCADYMPVLAMSQPLPGTSMHETNSIPFKGNSAMLLQAEHLQLELRPVVSSSYLVCTE